MIGDTVNIWDVWAEENCASHFSHRVTASQDTVTWVQTDTAGPLMTCLCLYNMRVSLSGLSSGQYRAMVFREELTRYSYPRDTVILIGSIGFSVESPGSSLASQFYQSGCNPVSVSDRDQVLVPDGVTLESYPNPFNSMTTISYTLHTRSHVRLEVYNMLGQRVAVLADQEIDAGRHALQWQAEVASGAYECHLTATTPIGSATVVKMLLVLK